MAKFKKGDRVRRTHSYHLGMQVGDVGTVISANEDNTVALREYPGSNALGSHNVENLELIQEKSMDNLQVGDVLVSEGWEDRIVMLVVGKYVITADQDDGMLRGDTLDNLKEDFRLKDSPEIKEVSMDEVAKALNVPVEQLRIKKED
jgi:hypothetical protein